MKETMRRVRTKDVVDAHGVRRVLHFTAVEYFPSIVQHGLLSVQECRRRGLEVVITDCIRFADSFEFRLNTEGEVVEHWDVLKKSA